MRTENKVVKLIIKATKLVKLTLLLLIIIDADQTTHIDTTPTIDGDIAKAKAPHNNVGGAAAIPPDKDKIQSNRSQD